MIDDVNKLLHQFDRSYQSGWLQRRFGIVEFPGGKGISAGGGAWLVVDQPIRQIFETITFRVNFITSQSILWCAEIDEFTVVRFQLVANHSVRPRIGDLNLEYIPFSLQSTFGNQICF